MKPRSRSERGVHQIGGARPLAAHAHVERAVVAEREAALRPHRAASTRRRDRAGCRRPPRGRGRARHARDWRSDPRPASAALRPASTSAKPPAIALRSRSMPMTRVPPTSRIARVCPPAPNVPSMIDAAIARRQLLEHLAGEHGNMTGQSASDRVAAAARHHSRAFCASCAATREPSCFFNARTVPVASASCARKRPGSQI